jgi:protein-S-isoprenylcysteine O-methyltransferase Ste14
MSAEARKAIGGFAFIAFFLVALFVPSWTFRFRQGWVYLAVSLASGAAIVAHLQRTDPRLLERRLRGPAAEKEASQNLIQLAAVIVFAGTIVLSSLDHRFGWSHVPLFVTIAGCALIAICRAGIVVRLLMLVPMALILAWRIRYEELFLTEHLRGYADYCQSVRYRVLPLVW